MQKWLYVNQEVEYELFSEVGSPILLFARDNSEYLSNFIHLIMYITFQTAELILKPSVFEEEYSV